jgi:PAS domain S-box-containing protein
MERNGPVVHLLDKLFYFPPDRIADPEFVKRLLDLLHHPVLVVDSKARPQFRNSKYDKDISAYTARLSQAARRRHMKIFSDMIAPHVASCLKNQQAELVPAWKLPVSKETIVDIAVCPARIQGSELAFVIGLPPRPADQLTKDAVLDAIFEGFDAAVISLDGSLRLRKLNSLALAAFRLTGAEALGNRISDLNPSEQASVLERQMEHMISVRAAVYERTYPLASAKRGAIQSMVMVWPLLDEAGVPSAVCDGVMVVAKPLVPESALPSRENWQQVLGKTVDTLGPATFFTHMDGRVVFMTRGAGPLLGRLADREQLNIIKDVPWSDPEAILGLYATLGGGSGFSPLLTGLKIPGGTKALRIMAYGLKDMGDIVSQVLLVVHDVTEVESYRRMMAETTKSLAAERDILEKAVELLDLPVAVFDSDLRIRRVNKALAARVNIKQDEAVGRPIGDIIATAHQTGMVDHIKRGLNEGKEVHLPRFEHVTRDGVVIPMEGHLYPIVVDGKIGCLAIARELVEKERLENEAAWWAQLYEAVASSTRDGVVVHDALGTVIDANPVVTEPLGGKGKLVGGPADRLVTFEEADLLKSFANRAMASGKKVETGRVKLTRTNTGESVFVEVTNVPVRKSPDAPAAAVTVVHYTTASEKLEDQVKSYTDNLEKIVNERTRELTSANEALSRSLERMASVAKTGAVLSSIRDPGTVLDTFLGQVKQVLGADFASLALVEDSGGPGRATYHTSGEAPPPEVVPPEIVEAATARLILGTGTAESALPEHPGLLAVNVDMPDAKGLLLVWKREGRFDSVDTGLAKILTTQLKFAFPVTVHVADLQRERERADCLRRIAVRASGASSVGDALRIVAEEVAGVVDAERFLWLVRSGGDQIWLSEVYNRQGVTSQGPRRANLGGLAKIEAIRRLEAGLLRSFCERSGAPGSPRSPGFEERGKAADQQVCPFGRKARDGEIKSSVRGLLETAGLVPPGGGSFAVSPVVLADGSWGLLCAYSSDGAATSCEDACFTCLAASTVSYVWQAADTASALRTLEVAGETVSDLAHDLKYPLMRIAESLSELGARESEESAGTAPVSRIRQEVANLTALTRELTEVSNPGNRKAEIVDLREVVDHCVALVGDDLRTRSITIANAVGDVPPVFADRSDIVKIALAILANSADAVKEAGSITVAARVIEGPEGRQAGLVFEDSGPGVVASEIDKVFAAFYTTKQGGSGLGLFSAKKRARANGGDIVCEMGPLGKSRFVMVLPVAAA